jgi:hypothetical protein
MDMTANSRDFYKWLKFVKLAFDWFLILGLLFSIAVRVVDWEPTKKYPDGRLEEI